MRQYLVVIEETETGYSAYSPDIPGCIATGSTRREVESNMREALEFHLDGLREEGESLPEPKSYSRYIKTPA
jgi:predicted RNase H-like HicB family nuclease